MSVHRLLFAACAVVLGLSVNAAEPTPDGKVLLTERGKSLFADDFSKELTKEWRAAKGKWEIKDGVLVGAEVKDDKHAAVLAHTMEFHDAAVQLSFKLDGAKTFAISINDANSHVCRVQIMDNSLVLKKDPSEKGGKAVTLETVPLTLKTGTWHTLVLEMQGKEILASVDGDAVAFGANDGIDVDKASVRLVVTGEPIAIKDLRVWETSPGKDWEATKKKLLEARKAREANK